MKLKTYVNYFTSPTAANSAVGTTVLELGKWNQVYFSLLYTSGKFGEVLVQINGGPVDSFHSGTVSMSRTWFSTSDLIAIGSGFIGQLRRFQVYSPAALELNSQPCDSTTCTATLGFSDPQTCLEAVCSNGYYTSFGSCEGILFRCFFA